MATTVSEELRLRRLLGKLQQQAVAALAGISQSELSRIENGWLVPSEELTQRILGAIERLRSE